VGLDGCRFGYRNFGILKGSKVVLYVDGCNAAGAGSGDGLTVSRVNDVASCEDAGDGRP
jgi:hypothetical protein